MSRQQDTINTIEDLQKIERKLQEEYGVKSPKEQNTRTTLDPNW